MSDRPKSTRPAAYVEQTRQRIMSRIDLMTADVRFLATRMTLQALETLRLESLVEPLVIDLATQDSSAGREALHLLERFIDFAEEINSTRMARLYGKDRQS